MTEKSFTDSKRYALQRPPRETILTHLQVAGKKQRDNAALDAELKEKREAQEKRDKEEGEAAEASGPADILAAEEDEDVIF